MEKITVIIPVYNAEKTIKECLDSVKNQSYRELEVLIINDGSSDQTMEICKAYAKEDPRIKILIQSNSGVSSARNCGIKNASGKYLAFVDADDYIERGMIESLYQMYQDDCQVDWAICNCELKMEEGFQVPEMQCEEYMSQVQAIRSLFGPKSICGYLCNKLFRVDIIREHKLLLDETIHVCEDLLFCCQYGLYIRNARYIDRKLYHYIMNFQGATWGKYSQKRFTEFYAFEKMRNIVRELDDRSVNDALDGEYMVACIRLVKKVLRNRGFCSEEMKELMRGIRSIKWRFLCSAWGWKYKMCYVPLKIVSWFY